MEDAAGGMLEVRGHSGLHSDFKASPHLQCEALSQKQNITIKPTNPNITHTMIKQFSFAVIFLEILKEGGAEGR